MDKRECALDRVIKVKELIKIKTNIDMALSNIKYNYETKEFEKTPCYVSVKEFIGIKNVFKKIFYNIFFK